MESWILVGARGGGSHFDGAQDKPDRPGLVRDRVAVKFFKKTSIFYSKNLSRDVSRVKRDG